MLAAISDLDWWIIIILCLTLGLAPFTPQPHIIEKLRMLVSGTLNRPIDIFDLFLHSIPFLLLIIKIGVTFIGKQQ